MAATKRRPKKKAPLSEAAGSARAREATRMLVESMGLLPIMGGLLGGLPMARRGGQDAPQILNEVQLQQYRSIARWAYEHNEYYGGLIDNGLVNYECGVSGFEWKAGLKGSKLNPEDVPPPEVARADKTLKAFRDEDGWWDRSSEESRRVYRDGNSFLRLYAAEFADRNAQCRFVEPEHISAPPTFSGDQQWRFGILALRHDAERHLAYFVRSDPTCEGEVVRAAGVAWQDIPEHLIQGLRRGGGVIIQRKNPRSDRAVKIGLPLLWGGSDGLEQAETLIDNLTGVAAYLSTISHYRQHAPGVNQQGLQDFQALIKNQQQDDGTFPGVNSVTPFFAGLGTMFQAYLGNRANLNNFEIGGGPQVIDITNGLEMVPPPVQSNIAGFLSILDKRIMAACVLTGVPFFMASSDASNNNFASIKEAGAPFVVATSRRQAHKAVKEKQVAETILIFAGVDDPMVEVTVTPPPVAMKPDLDVAQIQEIKIRSKTLSPQEAIRQDGRDPKITMNEVKAWEDAFPDDTGSLLPLGDEGGGGILGKMQRGSLNGNGAAK